MDLDRAQKKAKNPIEGKVSSLESDVEDSELLYAVAEILTSVSEGKLNKALKFLYLLHKSDIPKWFKIESILLSLPHTAKSLQTIAMLLNASKKNSLTESARTVPGLSISSF